MSYIEFSYSFSVLVGALALWLGAAWLCWQNIKRRSGVNWVLWLESLRLLIITLLGFTLLKPEYVKQIVRKEKPEVVILCDGSESMLTRDLAIGGRILSRLEWITQQKSNRFWKGWEDKAKVIVQDFSSYKESTNSPSIDQGTDINSALESTLNQYKNLKAVLLLSDGDWNMGSSPVSAAMKYALNGIPIYSVAIGSQTPLPDIAVEQVKTESYGLLGEQMAIPVKVKNFMSKEIKTEVQLYDSEALALKKEIILPAYGEAVTTLLWQPRTIGDHFLRVSVPIENGEYLKDNNEQSFRVSVRTEKLTVLIIESLPRWEYRYLRNALQRDPGVDVYCLLYHPGLPPGGGDNYLGGGDNYLQAFPESKDELSKFDVVFIGDVGIGQGELTEKQAELIKGLVEQQGSGLVFLPGIRGRQLTLVKSPLGELLPVIYDETKPNGIGFSTESTLQLTSTGRGHFLTMLESTPERNEELWKTLPGFYWSAGVLKSRPGSEVLGVHSGLRNEHGRIPLLVTRPFGNGETLFMGTDSAWRWRKGVEDRYHYRFWGQVVRWMAHKRHLAAGKGIRLVYSPENPNAGDSMYVYATIMDEKGMPLEKGNVKLSLKSPSGKVDIYELNAVPGGWGVFNATVPVKEAGRYKIEISGDKIPHKFETEINVEGYKREKMGQPINYVILKEITELSNGACVMPSEFNKIVEQIGLLPEPKPLEIRVRLWSNPYWAGFILALLAIYWTGRKIAGMV